MKPHNRESLKRNNKPKNEKMLMFIAVPGFLEIRFFLDSFLVGIDKFLSSNYTGTTQSSIGSYCV